MDWQYWVGIIGGVATIGFPILIGVLGTKWTRAKRFIKEMKEVWMAIDAAVEDDNITKEEVQQVAKEMADVISVFH